METIQEIIKAKQATYKYFTEKEAIEAVKNDSYNLKYVKQQTEAICIEAVKQNGNDLRYVKDQTEAICIEAVKQNGDALQYVKDQTEAICIEAVKQNGYALRYVKDQTEAICIEAVKQNGDALRYVNETLFIKKPVEWKTFIIETMGEEVPSRFIKQYWSFDLAKEDNKTAITITEIKLNFEIV